MTAPTVARNNPNSVVNRVQVVLSGTYTAASDVYTNSDGSVVLDGSGNLKIAPGFIPSYVKVINATDRTVLEWFSGMAASNYMKSVAAGTKTLGTDGKLIVASLTTGAAPVKYEGTALVTVVAGAALGFNDNTTSVVIIEG